nr:uncharacterized protein LOC120368059 [Saimiri boliviensis boliviensis]
MNIVSFWHEFSRGFAAWSAGSEELGQVARLLGWGPQVSSWFPGNPLTPFAVPLSVALGLGPGPSQPREGSRFTSPLSRISGHLTFLEVFYLKLGTTARQRGELGPGEESVTSGLWGNKTSPTIVDPRPPRPRPRDPGAEIDRCRSRGQCLPGATVTVLSFLTRPLCPFPAHSHTSPFLLWGKFSHSHSQTPAPCIWAQGPRPRDAGRGPALRGRGGGGSACCLPWGRFEVPGTPVRVPAVAAREWAKREHAGILKEPVRSLDFPVFALHPRPPLHTHKTTDAKIILPSGKSQIWRPSSESNSDGSSRE